MVIAFTVGVIGVEMAETVEGQIVRIAKAVGVDLAGGSVGTEAHHRAHARIEDRRGGGADVLLRDAGIVAASEIEPAIGTLDDAVGPVLGMAQVRPDFGFAIGLVIAIGVAQEHDRVVAGADQMGAVKAQAMCAALGPVGEEGGAVGTAVAIVVVQDFDVALTGDSDTSTGIDRQGEDVMGEFVVGIEVNLEPLGNRKG